MLIYPYKYLIKLTDTDINIFNCDNEIIVFNYIINYGIFINDILIPLGYFITIQFDYVIFNEMRLYLKNPKKLYGVYDCQNIYYTLQGKLCFNFNDTTYKTNSCLFNLKDLEGLVCLI